MRNFGFTFLQGGMQIVACIIVVCVIVGGLLVLVLGLTRIVGALFSLTVRGEVRKHWVFHALCTALVILYLLGLMNPWHETLGSAKKAKTANLMQAVQTAFLSYDTEYSTWPPGKDNAALIKNLEGDNPRGIAFLSLRSSDKNAHGEIIDPWGTPLRIMRKDPDHFGIESAGPDRTWNTSDDLAGTISPESP